MAPERALKVAFIGTHGVGKTTLCYGLAARLKARDVALEIVHEVARRCPLPINEATTVAAQAWILHTQIGEELVAAPALTLDAALIHMHRGDARGNGMYLNVDPYMDDLVAMAAPKKHATEGKIVEWLHLLKDGAEELSYKLQFRR